MAYIKNIIKVEITEAENLKGMAFPSLHTCILPSDASFRQIACKNPSSCEITDKVESKVRIFTFKLTFRSCEQIAPGGKQLAYRVTTPTDAAISSATSIAHFRCSPARKTCQARIQIPR